MSHTQWKPQESAAHNRWEGTSDWCGTHPLGGVRRLN